AACTSEKHFARSERRIVRHRRTTEAQSAARPLWRKRRQPFSTVSPRRGAQGSPPRFFRGILFLLQPARGRLLVRDGGLRLRTAAHVGAAAGLRAAFGALAAVGGREDGLLPAAGICLRTALRAAAGRDARLRPAGGAHQDDLVAAAVGALGLRGGGDQGAVAAVDVAVGLDHVAGVAVLLLLLGAVGQLVGLHVVHLIAGGAEDLPGHLHVCVVRLCAVDADGELA